MAVNENVKNILGEIKYKYNLRQSEIAKQLGVQATYLSDVANGRAAFTNSLKANILLNFPDITQVQSEECSDAEKMVLATINYEGKGVPYYDVDFIGGFDLVFNDQTTRPAYYINFPGYDSADCWVNVTGHSMEPEVSHGDIIAVKELKDWSTHILYGEMYALVTEENRTIKYIRRSEEGKDWLRLVPVNKAEYDEQDIPKDVIRKVFKVLGSAKRFQ